MRFLFVAIVTLTSSFSLAQQVKVQTGSGGVQVDTGAAGVQVDTGPGGVRVDTGTGTSVKTKAGNVTVKTGQGTTTVQTGGANVRVETKPGSVNVAAPPPAVVQPAPVPAVVTDVGDDDEELVIQENGQTIEHTCGADQQVIVNGNDNGITLHGPCKDVHVNGDRNRIATDSVQSIVANGDSNQIQWRATPNRKNPKVSTNGNKNQVSKLR